MAHSKSRLGRGLASLISGGTPAQNEKQDTAEKASPPRKSPSKKARSTASRTTGPERKRRAAAESRRSPSRSTPVKTTAPAKTTAAKNEEVSGTTGLREIPIQDIVPNPHQPRKDFDEASIAELAESIRSEGLIQPIVVRAVGDHYELIAGERRWRACQTLKLKRVPARILEASESSSAVMSLIENLQRENLNPIEEALGYASLLSDFGLTQEAVSERVGKARASVANSLRLLQLDREIQQYISRRMLSAGHAKALLGLAGADEQALVARQVIERQLSVRDTERLVQNQRKGASVTATSGSRSLPPAEKAAIEDVEKRLARSLNTRVQLRHSPKKGRILIEYYGNDDLQRILEQIGVSV